MEPDGVRMSELAKLFRDTWSFHPDFACRAPGRVNLIGEHIDYHGFSVLPMATESDIMVVGAAVQEVNGAKFLREVH